jgi:hypothetical protein
MIPHDFYLFWGVVLPLRDKKKREVYNPMKVFCVIKLGF